MNQTKAIVPLYIQITERLLDRIQSGKLTSGDRLPPERELSETLGVNRRTVREALRVLEMQGLITRQRGVGAFITQPKIEREADHLVPFTEGMQSRGYTTGAKVVLLERRMCAVSAAAQLNLPVSSPVYYGHRLRFLNNEPTMLEKFINLTRH